MKINKKFEYNNIRNITHERLTVALFLYIHILFRFKKKSYSWAIFKHDNLDNSLKK